MKKIYFWIWLMAVVVLSGGCEDLVTNAHISFEVSAIDQDTQGE